MSDTFIFGMEVFLNGLMAGVLYALVALGFVLIYKASGIFNYAQGVMALFAAMTLVGVMEGRRVANASVRPGPRQVTGRSADRAASRESSAQDGSEDGGRRVLETQSRRSTALARSASVASGSAHSTRRRWCSAMP